MLRPEARAAAPNGGNLLVPYNKVIVIFFAQRQQTVRVDGFGGQGTHNILLEWKNEAPDGLAGRKKKAGRSENPARSMLLRLKEPV